MAVKVLKSEDPSEAEAFLHEISILEGLHHLHVRPHDSAHSAANHESPFTGRQQAMPEPLTGGVATAAA